MTTPSLQPMPAYFLIKIGKVEQQEKKEKIGNLYFPTQFAYMRRELQFGEIVAIGEDAKSYMPAAEVGDYLLIHHLISGKKTDKGYNFYLVDEDDDFNYYAVNAFEVPGERSMAYGIAKGEEIIPTPDYIFLEVPKDEDGESQTDSGIIKIEKKKSRDEWMAIMKANMERVKQLSRNIPHGPMEEILTLRNPERREKHEYAISEIKKLEAINLKISKDINKKKYEPFKVASINPEWQSAMEKFFGDKINEGDFIYMLNLACHTTIDFSGTNYIIAETKYFAGSLNWMKNGIKSFNARYNPEHNNITAKKRADKVRG